MCFFSPNSYRTLAILVDACAVVGICSLQLFWTAVFQLLRPEITSILTPILISLHRVWREKGTNSNFQTRKKNANRIEVAGYSGLRKSKLIHFWRHYLRKTFSHIPFQTTTQNSVFSARFYDISFRIFLPFSLSILSCWFFLSFYRNLFLGFFSLFHCCC